MKRETFRARQLATCIKALPPAWPLHWCPSCEDHMPAGADGCCKGCDDVIDERAAETFEQAQIEDAFAEDRWRPRIVWDLTGSYGSDLP